jgi:hypothetical protein
VIRGEDVKKRSPQLTVPAQSRALEAVQGVARDPGEPNLSRTTDYTDSTDSQKARR